MIYLVLTSTKNIYADTASQAAVEAGAQPWNNAKLVSAIHKLNHGDELTVSDDVSIVVLTGVDVDYVA